MSYQQRLPVSRVAPQTGTYQTLPSAVSANRTATVVSTPVAIEPAVQRQTSFAAAGSQQN